MSIISISVDEDLLKQVDLLQKEFSFSGRSDFFRAALNNLVLDLKQKKVVEGEVDALLFVMHSKQNNVVAKIMHSYSSLIKTQTHAHTKDKKCQEVFFLFGDFKKINQMQEDLKKSKKIQFVKLFIL